MKINKYLLGTTALALTLVAGASVASAYQGDYTKQGPDFSPERHTAMTEAFTNLDYNTWSEMMSNRGRVAEVINEENFAQFVEAHQLAQSGDYAGADAIRQELGLRTRGGETVGAGFKGANGTRQGLGQGRGNK